MLPSHHPANPHSPGAPTLHSFKGAQVRTIDREGEPWFVAADVAAALGLRDANRATRLLDDDEKGAHTVGTPGGVQSMQIINESGLYALVLRSRKPEARPFQKWVTSVVLPAIRRDGGYIKGEELLTAQGLGWRELEAREAFLKDALAAVLDRKAHRGRSLEEREARAAGFKALRRK